MTKKDDQNHEGVAGVLMVGAMRAAMFGLKKGAITGYVRKQAFLQISSTIAVKGTVNKASSSWKHYSMKVVKNSLLGMAVFGTYDFVTFMLLGDSSRPATTNNLPGALQSSSLMAATTTTTATPVLHAGAAGLCAGVVHSATLIVWEILTGKKNPHWNPQKLKVVQHSLGYASLFGTYEGARRLLEYGFYDLLSFRQKLVEYPNQKIQHPWMTARDDDGSYYYYYDITPWSFSFLAGGLAGHVHQVVGHAIANTKTKLELRKIPTILVRPTVSSFCMTGLCFVAFEFGGELTERAIIEQTSSG